MPTNKKVEDKSVTKTPRTVKVSTILWTLLCIAVIIAAIGFGWIMRSDADAAYNNDVHSAAQELVTSLK